MIERRTLILLAAISIVTGVFGPAALSLSAAEKSHAFIEGLRQRQYYDTALDYLDSIRTSRLVDKSFLDVIDYQVGVTLMESARLLPMVDREKRLNEARTAFEKFITERPWHWLVIEAQADLANLLVDRGRLKMALASRFKRTPEDKEKLKSEARALFQDAQKLFIILDTKLTDKLKDYKDVDPRNETQIAERDQYRRNSMRARLVLGSIILEIAKTYEPGSDEFKENLKAAAESFAEYSEKYSKWVGGYAGKIEEARSYQEMGDYATALKLLAEVREKEDFHEDFRAVRTSATAMAIEICSLPEVKKHEEAMNIFAYWEKRIAAARKRPRKRFPSTTLPAKPPWNAPSR